MAETVTGTILAQLRTIEFLVQPCPVTPRSIDMNFNRTGTRRKIQGFLASTRPWWRRSPSATRFSDRVTRAGPQRQAYRSPIARPRQGAATSEAASCCSGVLNKRLLLPFRRRRLASCCTFPTGYLNGTAAADAGSRLERAQLPVHKAGKGRVVGGGTGEGDAVLAQFANEWDADLRRSRWQHQL